MLCLVAQLFQLSATPQTVACQTPLSMGILQARILEWVATPSSRGSSQPRDQIEVSSIVGGFFTIWATREAPWCSYMILQISKDKHLIKSDCPISWPNRTDPFIPQIFYQIPTTCARCCTWHWTYGLKKTFISTLSWTRVHNDSEKKHLTKFNMHSQSEIQ